MNCITTMLLTTGLVLCTAAAQAQTPQGVIPRPVELKTVAKAQPFILNTSTTIVYPQANDKMARNAQFLQEYIQQITTLAPALALQTPKSKSAPKNAIVLKTGLKATSPEAYQMTIGKNGITIEGASEAGVFYGIQTLRKSLPVGQASEITLDAVQINDTPRFAWRGMMLDCCRHFFPKEFVKKYIDLLALHNCNRLHWHLNDDQGWRIEIKKYPRLTEVGSKRTETVIGRNMNIYDGTPYGGFYTQEDAREIVRYAAERFVTVIPEIDMPGHMLGALAAYPELGCEGEGYEVWKIWGVSDQVLCAGQESTYQFTFDVLAEIIDIFPSEVIHIGGDECPKDAWVKCPRCQARIQELQLTADDKGTAEQKLQSHFTQRMAKFVAEHGRRVIGWDEVLEGGIPQDVMIMSWRGEKGGIEAARLGHDVVMTPNDRLYFDYYQTKNVEQGPFGIGGHNPIEKVYNYEPMPDVLTEAEKTHIMGVQANLWTEYVCYPQHVEFMTLPRLAALCEVQWSAPGQKDYASFLQRMPHMLALYDLLGYQYARYVLKEIKAAAQQ